MSYKNDFAVLVTALSAGLLTGSVHEIVTDWPNIGLWGFIWFSIGSVAMSVATALIMYLGVFGTTRGAQAVFSCALIALCIANYISFEQIKATLACRDYDEAYSLYLIKFAKSAASVGVGALAVNVLANTFPTRSPRP